MLASGGGDHRIILWDAATGQPLGQPLTGHTDEVNSVAFSPDGKLLASASVDKTVRLWDVATGQLLSQPFTGHTAGVNDVAFSPDGKTLVSAGADKALFLWDINFESLPAIACQVANRNLTRQEWKQYIGDEPYRAVCSNLPTPDK
jgi:WD40 repeat protein